MKQAQASFAFNRGLVSPLGIARVEQKRVALGAKVMTNFDPRVLGSMTLRAGFQYLGAAPSKPRHLPFIFSTTDTALYELTDELMRIWVDDELVERVAVSSTITNGTFDGDITGWTVSGGSVSYSGGNMSFVANGTVDQTAYQTITNASPSVEHGIRIVVARGPIRLRIGSTVGGQEYISERTLDTGTFSFGFTPTGDFTIYFLSSNIPAVLLESVTIESAGVLTLPTSWETADLDMVRSDQSGDILFCACEGQQQRRIERHTTRSWGISLYLTNDGPFRIENVTPTTLTPSAINGDITLTASKAIFSVDQVGALFTLQSTGQTVTKSATALNDATNSIRVTGTGTDRNFTIVLSGFFDGVRTMIVERSFDDSTWVAVPTLSYIAAVTTSYTDGLENQIVYYRFRVSVVGGAGTTVMVLSISTGSIVGTARVTGFTSTTVVSAQVLTDFGTTNATDVWAEGNWSDLRGWPTAVRFHEGRLWWFGKNGIWGSVSDAFYSFDASVVGDSGPLNRTIGSGPVDVINWAISLPRMIIGAQGAELSVRSSSLDEPLTPTNFNVKTASTQGSAAVDAVKIDQRGVYVQRGGSRLFELGFDVKSYDYNSGDLTTLVPELCSAGITRMAVQRQPDTRIHVCLTDDDAALMVRDSNEDVICWSNIETDGIIEDVVTLPGEDGSNEDRVYYAVKRTINGTEVWYLEKKAMEVECRGTYSTDPLLNKQADSFIIYDGAAATTITGLTHLEGEEVVVWGDGTDFSPNDEDGVQTTYTVTSGAITLDDPVSKAIIGLPYEGRWESTKLGLQTADTNSLLTHTKRLDKLGLIMAWVHAKGLQYGADFDNMNDLPEIEDGAPVDADAVRESYDEQEIEFPGIWLTDLTLCLKAHAPRPVTVLAAVSYLDT